MSFLGTAPTLAALVFVGALTACGVLVDFTDRYYQEWALIIYVALEYFHTGLSLERAYKDLLYHLGAKSTVGIFQKEIAEIRGRTKMLLPVSELDPHITKVCKTSIYTQMVSGAIVVPPHMFHMDTADPLPTEERVQAYLEACKRVYIALDPKGVHRTILDSLQPRLEENVTTPTLTKFTLQAVLEGRKRREAAAAAKPDHSHRWKPAGEVGFPYIRHADFRPVKEERIRASEIPDAVRAGKVAVFDATELLPHGLFNLTIPQLAALHGEDAESIPMYREQGAAAPGRSGWESLREYGERVATWWPSGKITYPEHRPWRESLTPAEMEDIRKCSRPSAGWLEALADVLQFVTSADLRLEYKMLRSKTIQCAVNTRRLTKLPPLNIEKALGNPDWLERAWSMFWLGAPDECWHTDDPDNLLIAVNGEIYVSVFEQQDSEAIRANGDRGCWGPVDQLPRTFTQTHMLQENSWVKKFPFITMKLEPGMGVVVPSATYHSISNPDGGRILMNVFMQPKFGGLWDAPAAKYSFYRREMQTKEYAALRHLKCSTIYRLWDTMKLGGHFEASKLELL